MNFFIFSLFLRFWLCLQVLLFNLFIDFDCWPDIYLFFFLFLLIFVFFRHIFFVVMDCEHVIIFDAILEHFDGQRVIKDDILCSFADLFRECDDIFDETFFKGLIQLFIIFVLAETEDVVYEFKGFFLVFFCGKLGKRKWKGVVK